MHIGLVRARRFPHQPGQCTAWEPLVLHRISDLPGHQHLPFAAQSESKNASHAQRTECALCLLPFGHRRIPSAELQAPSCRGKVQRYTASIHWNPHTSAKNHYSPKSYNQRTHHDQSPQPNSKPMTIMASPDDKAASRPSPAHTHTDQLMRCRFAIFMVQWLMSSKAADQLGTVGLLGTLCLVC